MSCARGLYYATAKATRIDFPLPTPDSVFLHVLLLIGAKTWGKLGSKLGIELGKRILFRLSSVQKAVMFWYPLGCVFGQHLSLHCSHVGSCKFTAMC